LTGSQQTKLPSLQKYQDANILIAIS